MTDQVEPDTDIQVGRLLIAFCNGDDNPNDIIVQLIGLTGNNSCVLSVVEYPLLNIAQLLNILFIMVTFSTLVIETV